MPGALVSPPRLRFSPTRTAPSISERTVSRSASAMASVRIAARATNAPAPRWPTKRVRAPYVQPCSSRRFWFNREVNEPPSAMLMRSSRGNASLAAAFLAADDGGEIGMRHLVRGVALEYQKLGRLTIEADFEQFHELIR